MESLRFALKTLWKNIVADVSALGGLPFYAVFILYYALTDAAVAWQLIYALTILFVAVYSIKLVYFKARPDVAKKRFSSLAERLESSSFPSVHAARATMLYVALFHGTALGAFGLFMALCVCASRILLKRHYARDVVAGAALGTVIGYGMLSV